ncbi:MAG: hypothetical protein H7248_01535 [Microbacteriaceae bacterium]|nr:hypothetical protein [Microbacteriaceae bacterium]
MKFLLSRTTEAKARVLALRKTGGMLAVLRSERGALDLASIMVGVLVIGIVGGVIAATVFAVIPWSQDRAAQGALDAVKTAESVQYGQSAGGGTGVFAVSADLVGTGNATGKSLLQASNKISVKISSDGQRFIAASASDTGTVYFISDDGQAPSTTAPTTTPAIVAPVWNNTTKTFS